MTQFIFSYAKRLAMSAGLAVLISIFIAGYFQLNFSYLIALSGFLVCFTSPGASLRQSLITAALIIISLFVVIIWHKYFISSLVPIFFIFVISLYLASYYYPLKSIQFSFIILFPLAILATTQTPLSLNPGDPVFIACTLGALIGVVTSTILKIRKIEKEFKQSVAPVVRLICEYTSSLRIAFQDTKFSQDFSLKNQIEKELSAWTNRYPEWIFDTGFNPGLRVGYRYFLIKLDQVIEALFSLSYLFTKTLDSANMLQIKEPMKKVLESNLDLLEVISNFLNNKALPTTSANYMDDIQGLEAAVAKILPQSIELLDINTDGLIISAIVKDLKDLRQLLIQLIAALPAS